MDELDAVLVKYLLVYGADQLFDVSYVAGEMAWLNANKVNVGTANNHLSKLSVSRMRLRFRELERQREPTRTS